MGIIVISSCQTRDGEVVWERHGCFNLSMSLTFVPLDACSNGIGMFAMAFLATTEVGFTGVLFGFVHRSFAQRIYIHVCMGCTLDSL